MTKKLYLLLTTAVFLSISGFHSDWINPIDINQKGISIAESAQWTIDQNHSEVGFSVRHLAISKVRGEFNTFEAEISFEESDLTTLAVSAVVDVASIDTGVERRDNHLRSEDFFDSESYAQILFVSKEVRNADGSDFELVGDLTIKDVTMEVVLEGSFLGAAGSADQRKAGFELTGKIDRFDYNLKWDRLTEAGGLVAGRDITITLNMELNQVSE